MEAEAPLTKGLWRGCLASADAHILESVLTAGRSDAHS